MPSATHPYAWLRERIFGRALTRFWFAESLLAEAK